MKVESWLARAARLRPGHPAVGEVTYAELLDRAAALADDLPPGERVVIDDPPGEQFAIRLHAALLAGAVAVPRPAAAEQAKPVAPAQGLACPAAGRYEHELDRVAIEVQTSGTSAEPKTVSPTYGNLLWSALGSAAALGHREDERWLCAMPLNHVGGLSILVRSAIAATTVIIHERFDADRVLAELRRPDGPTIVSLVPTTLRRLLDVGLTEPPSLRTVLLGGAPIPAGLLDAAREARVPVTTTYGLTEACSQVATDGRPLFCTRLKVAADGELLVAGPTVAPGSLADDGWLHTGDLGAIDAAGRLTITGRKSETIISGGENISPAEVEAVLDRHPAVSESAVIGVPDSEWGERLVAVVRGNADAAEIAAHCAALLPGFKCPKELRFTTKPLPRTESGKLLRRKVVLDDI